MAALVAQLAALVVWAVRQVLVVKLMQEDLQDSRVLQQDLSTI